ncbi:DUF2326 domain-containing protein [Rhodococcoides corynebacterioides]|uniref:DUF2326 domain-containing protein n=1 Tax=Rhodococcoides corynebacterioides TaxID=53972 RepID=A0ABS7NZR9_9NOCA|nr:DUF2326 domain-containing protein [Rhodococcus corynebacterioides]MBY6365643.1 DUF2326 domain-containing protein [Rhodococcus corynebacterioides]MBY6406374.1 DUF2326 domain-containing protein [Rhodococcus corynebacterioides]
MLVRLSANRDEFKPVAFRPGFNAIVADRAEESTQQDSRNARGKSTLLMLINYVLAGQLHKTLKPLAEDGWEMTLELQMFGGTVAATRSLAKGGKSLIVRTDGQARAVFEPYLVEGRIALDDWKTLLGLALFRLEPDVQGSAGGISVRTLLSYVIRTEMPKDPLKIIAQQGATSSREHVAFLLGLDWKVVHELAAIKKGLSQISTISAATREGLVATFRPEKDLVLERAAVMHEIEEWQHRIDRFRILEDPNSLVKRVDELTDSIARLRDDAVVDQRMHALYLESLADTDGPKSTPLAVEALFDAAGVILADGFRRQIDDVRDFHDSLLTNRRLFLRSEVTTIEQRIATRSAELDRLDQQRDNALRTLDAGGALDELNALRIELGEAEQRRAALDLQIEQARDLDARKQELKLEQSTIRSDAARELTISREKLDRISDRFTFKMRQLYGKDAALTVAVDDAGYLFSIRAAGSGSTGVDRMTMFCFDLTMLEEGILTGHHPDFLVHDSTVFDGVDPRQRAGAMRFAQQMVAQTNGQYICTINSNDVPQEVLGEDWFQAGVVRTVLDTEVGGLIGRAF